MLTKTQIRVRVLSSVSALALILGGAVAGGAAAAVAAPHSGTIVASSVQSGSGVAAVGGRDTWTPKAPKPYVALGDSFTAGQGAPPYSSDTCKVSKWASYPSIAALASLRAYTLTANKACSGALIADVPAQLAGIDPATALVTLTVGGIDAGSTGVLVACAAGPDTDACRAAIAASAIAINNLGPQLYGLYSQIAATLPNARIVVLNYPRLFKPGVAPLGELVNAGTDALNAVIAGAVAATGNPKISLVNVTDEFAGHGIGDKVPYIGFNPADVTAASNFHPNALGNLLGYARALASDGVLRR